MTSATTGNLSLASPTPRDVAATLFRRPRLMVVSFGFVLLATMLFVFLSARYESHFKVLLRRGRYDPVISAQAGSGLDFTRPEITEEELNSEVELLRDEDLLKQVAGTASLIPPDTPESERASAIEHAVRKFKRRLDVESLKKSNVIQVTYQDTDPARAARVLAALSSAYIRRHTNLQRPSGEVQFFDQQTAESEKRLHSGRISLARNCALHRVDVLQRVGLARKQTRV